MTEIKKPDYTEIWASEGGVNNPTLDQILSGWKQNQYPPSEIANAIQNKIETAVAYIFQKGVSEWDEDTTYYPSSLVLNRGVHYLATAESTGKEPSSGLTEGFWVIAFDRYGASDDLRAEVSKILTQDGYVPFYVKKTDPIMLSEAKAPSFLSETGSSNGFKFRGHNSGIYSLGGELLFMSNGASNGRIKNVAPTLDMNDDTLVTTALLKSVVEKMKKETQIPVGWSVITSNRKPPSDPDQLGYGIWTQDLQGMALVGVSNGTADNIPEWVKDPDSRYGEYKKSVLVENLPEHTHETVLLGGGNSDIKMGQSVASRWRDEKDYNGYILGGSSSEPNTGKSGKTGGSKPLDVVQPSQTKYIWTRTA